MDKKSVIFGGVVLALVVAALGWWFVRGGVDAPGAANSRPASRDTRNARKLPNVTLENYAGETVQLRSFTDTPLVVNSWAVWCPFCTEELSYFAAVQEEFADQVEIIAIDRAEPRGKAKEFTDDLGITEDLTFLLDPDDTFYAEIGGFSMPETVFVDADGRIVFHKRGPMDESEIRQRVKLLVNGEDPGQTLQ